MNIAESQVKPVTLDAVTQARDSVVSAEKNNTATSVPAAVVEQKASIEENTQSRGKQLQDAVSQINDHVQNLQRSLQFTVDEKSGKDVVTVSDIETKEVIRQYPSEEVLQIARNLAEQQEHDISLFSSSI